MNFKEIFRKNVTYDVLKVIYSAIDVEMDESFLEEKSSFKMVD